MDRNGQALARLVDDILDVSRVVSGKLHLEPRDISASDVVRAAVEQGRVALEAKRIVLATSIADDCPVLGDAMRLQQVVANLLSNATKFTREGGHVSVSLVRDEDQISLEVRDDGVGIPPEDLETIFEYFRQVDSSTTRAHAGLGLGLALARYIVEAHGGRIRASSEGPGKGAALRIDLPARPWTEGASASEPASVPSSRRRTVGGLKVLCVDDDPDNLELCALTLRARGAQVTTARSVGEALAVLEAFQPDVVVTDLAMPQRDGFELVCAMRAAAAARHGPMPPAIALTAHARLDDVESVLRAGFSRHLAKPVDPSTLAGAVAAVAGPGLRTAGC